jgi:hypothetical protein
MGGRSRKLHVFGKGLLDTLDDAFWMLPFSSKKQAQIVRQENDLTEDDWQRRRDQIMAEHRLDGARDQLRTQWKAWINQNVSKAVSQAEPRSPATAQEIPEFDA